MSDELDTAGAVASYLQTRKPQETVRASLSLAAGVNPDAEAEFRRLSKEAGLPIDSVRANKDEVQQRLSLPDPDDLAKRFPSTTAFLSSLDNARIAHDEVGNLTEIEESFRDAQRQGRAVRGKVDEPFSRPGDRRTSQGKLGEVFIRRGEMAGEERGFVGGVTEPVRRGLAQGDRGLTLLDLFPGLRERRDAARTAAGMAPSGNLDLAQQLATQQREVERFPVPEDIQRGQQEISAATTMGEAAEAILRNPRAVLEVSLQSLGISAPALAGAVAGSTMGPLGTAAGAGMGSFVVEYANTLQEVMAESGVDGKDALAVSAALGKPGLMAAAKEKAVKRGIPIALFDALTAGLAGRILAGARGTAGSIVPRIGGELGLQAGGGAAGEATAQAVTDEYKPGDILLEALAELPSAIVEVPANYSSAVERAEAKAAQAERLTQLAEASKLRARDPEAFKAFIEQVAQTGEGPAEFFIDAEQLANTLNQGSVTMEELQAMAPTVAKQLQGGFVPGADIRVPVTEFAAAPAEITTALIDHLRESPEAMSRAEAQRFLAEQGEQIKQDVEKTLETTASRAELQAEVARVTQEFKAQLDAVGKFRPEVNQAYATVLGNFFTTQAQRAGMSVDEFMERYQLKVGKGGKSQPARQRQLDQQFSRGAGGASTADTMRSELQARFGDIVQALESKGVLRLWDGIEAFNQGGQASALPADMAGIQGMFAQGVANLFGDGIEAGNAVAVFLHEVGEHASMRDMLGERYRTLVRRAYQLVKEGDPIAQRALMRIPDDTPRKFYDSEMVAYLIEEATLAQEPSPGIAQWLADVVAAVRAFFFAKGMDLELSPQDVAALAVRAVRWQAGQESAPAGQMEPAFSMHRVEQPAFHGSPHDFDRFSTDAIGTGEGAQAFGWGLYFAENKAIAEHYRDTLTPRGPATLERALGISMDEADALWAAARVAAGDLESTVSAEKLAFARSTKFRARPDAERAELLRRAIDVYQTKPGGLYQVEIADETVARMLLWDKPMSEQPDAVIEALTKAGLYEPPGGLERMFADRYADAVAALGGDPLAVRKAILDLTRMDREDGAAWDAAWDVLLKQNPRAEGIDLNEIHDSLRPQYWHTRYDHNTGEHITTSATATGEQFYRDLSESMADQVDEDVPGSPKGWGRVAFTINDRSANDRAASQKLDALGVTGIKYLDGGSRTRSLRDIKREFLAELPEDADFSEVTDLLGSGTFSSKNEAIIKALAADDWLGFDYPAQALSAALGKDLAQFDASDALKQAVADAQVDATHNLVVFNDKNVTLTHKDGSPVTAAERAEFFQGSRDTPRGTLSFGNDITAVPSIIALLEDADLSTFLHESGHWFLEVQSDLAARVQRRIFNEQYTGEPVSDSERQIVRDMEAILGWFGIQATPERSALDTWSEMTLEEKREHHEAWARGFEKYLMEGRAPSQELQGLFSKFRAWLVSVYKALAGLNVDLTDEVRQVMDRMLASDEAIAEAQMARDMGPLFESPEAAGMTPAEFRDYQALGARQTAEASAELDKRLMADMKWLSRARDKALKARQEEVEDLRREVRAEIRGEVMATPVYRAWAFLTGKLDRVDATKKPAQVGEETENLFAAIGRLGGLDREEVKTKWGISSKDDNLKSGLFGKPLLRKDGGLSIDAMAERLIEAGYLLPDENGKADLAKFEALFDDQRRGIDRFSIRKDYEAALGDAPAEPLDLPVSASGRLNTDELKRMYGEKPDAKWRLLSERRMTSPTGLDPEEVAVTFGFTSADHLVDNLVRAAPPQAVIEEMTDRAMLERYGDITSDAALQLAADEAVHNEVRARVVAAELRAMEKAGSVREGKRSTVNVIARAAKDYAYQIIARQRVRDLRPSQYSAAQARSAKLARQALGKSTEEVALHKRNELINTYAARAAYDAQEEVRALQRYFRKFDKRLDSIDPGYQDQIEQLLERFDFKPASLKAIDKRKSFAAWYAEQEAAGNAPAVPDELLAEANRKSYKDMTVEELRGLRDTVKQIEHQGRLKKKLLLARDERDFEAIAKQMAASIEEHGGQRREVELEGPNPVVDWFAGLAASHRKLSSLFRQMDGNNDNGPLWQFIGRPMNERSTMEEVMLEQATVKLAALYEPLTKMRGGITGKRSKLFIREINDSLTRGGRLAVALNWGNEANRQRLQDGNRWSVDQVQAVLKTLTPEELAFVNATWEFLDSYWPEIAAKEKRLTGVEPPKVEAAPFNVLLPDGTEVAMRGGYYPLKYDTNASDKASQQEAAQVAKEMMQGAFTRATTRRGHTKERLKEVKRKVRLDLNVITQHVTQVVHDLAWHEFLIDTNKLIGDERISGAIRDFYGPKVLKTIRDDILGIATADVIPQTDIDRALLTLRTNVTRATMGASLTTAFLQPFGLTQSIVRIGGRHVLRGLARWGGDAAKMENAVAWINERSEFMRLRGKTFNRELREIRGSVAGKSKAMKVIDAGLFVFMRKMQLVADVPTWLGQYEKSLSEGLSEADAIAMADRAVLESQGGGAIKDMAEVQRKHPMLTQFYSYFSVTLNLTAESTAATNFRNPAAVAGWLGDMALLLVIPAILPSFILYSLRGGDDEPEDLAKKVAQWQIGYLLGTVMGLRELSGAISGFDYAGPPVGRIIYDIGKAGKQTAQGELDEPLVLAYARLMGDAFGIPVTQILRSYKGWKAWDEGEEGAGPQSVLLGPPEKD